MAAVATFAFPAGAGATIVVNKGMFGISLGSTTTQVRHNLGRPYEVDHRGATTAWYYFERGLYVVFNREHRVRGLSTEGLSQHTTTGVGVGSSELAVIRLVPGVHCSPWSQDSRGIECVVASAHVSTDFHVSTRRGLVQYVLISRLP